MVPEAASRRIISRRGSQFVGRLIERVLRTRLTDSLVGSIVLVLPDGRAIMIGSSKSGTETPILQLKNYKLIFSCLRRGGLGFGDSYVNGDIECSDVVKVLQFYLINKGTLHRLGERIFKARSLDRLAHLLRHNSKAGSRRNISEHYDLGNDFYAHWLDREMNYSSGIYRTAEDTLEMAQSAKLERIRELLNAKQDSQILEIGSGWGALACSLAARDRVHVTGLTLSKEQFRHACSTARERKFSGTVSFALQDYRDATGVYDHIVSIEMIEAVGEAFWPVYFDTLSTRLKPGGTAILQAITMRPDLFAGYRKRADFVQRYIFPGGMLLTAEIIEREAGRAGLKLECSETFGSSYAQTLRDWRMRFVKAWPEINQLGFDPRFRRRWLYYLMYCEAGFDCGVIDVGLYKLAKA